MQVHVITELLKAGFSYSDLALLTGVHAVTIRKYHRGLTTPSAYQQALLESFLTAARTDPLVVTQARYMTVQGGPIAALRYLLNAGESETRLRVVNGE